MTEQQPYRIAAEAEGFELRHYPEHVVAELDVDSSFEDAGNRAFGTLAGYIGRGNTAGDKISMTAPVLQESRPDGGGYRVAFVLPSSLSVQTAPAPSDPKVTLRAVPAGYAAALKFSGRWTEGSFEEHARRLRDAVLAAGLTPAGTERYARYDPPFKPWFLRRNEVILPVEDPEEGSP